LRQALVLQPPVLLVSFRQAADLLTHPVFPAAMTMKDRFAYLPDYYPDWNSILAYICHSRSLIKMTGPYKISHFIITQP
jgi:hypothetical protein